jgi:DNA-binding response OmpR family regulator
MNGSLTRALDAAHPSPSHVRPGAERRTTVLLGDADEDVHVMYGAFLEHHGFAVLHARSVAECLGLARTRRVAAAVVSYGSCGLFHWRSYHELARAGRSAGFALVCLTTDPRLITDSRRHRRCAAAVLMLPCSPEDLAAEVERVAGEARLPPN